MGFFRKSLKMGYRGRRKSLKRLTAPKSWMLDKTGGTFAPKSSAGPHKSRDSFPMTLFLRNRLRYALSYQEVKKIVKQRLIKVDGKIRTDNTFPTGFMDVVSIERTNENFRILYDVKGRFTVQVDISSGKMKEFIKFDTGNLVMITGGHNLGRVGTIVNRERHPGSFDIVHIKDALGHTFATRLSYVFVIGKGNKPMISLPRGKGVKLSIAEERDRRIAAKTN